MTSPASNTSRQDDWDALTDAERIRWAGNIDPWLGPIDPAAEERALTIWRRTRNAHAAAAEQVPCGCWASDCAECGPRRAGGQRPPKGQRRRYVRSLDHHARRVIALLTRTANPKD